MSNEQIIKMMEAATKLTVDDSTIEIGRSDVEEYLNVHMNEGDDEKDDFYEKSAKAFINQLIRKSKKRPRSEESKKDPKRDPKRDCIAQYIKQQLRHHSTRLQKSMAPQLFGTFTDPTCIRKINRVTTTMLDRENSTTYIAVTAISKDVTDFSKIRRA